MARKSKGVNWVLAVILAVGLGLRLYRIDYPLMDWHSFRQADTVSVTQEFVRHHYPIWLPHYHDLGNIQSGLDNPEGYRMVEFPIVNYLLAWWLGIIRSTQVVWWSRLAAACVSTVSIFLLFSVVKCVMLDSKFERRRSLQVAYIAAAVLAVLPYGVYYGRAVLPEPFQVFFLLATLLCWVKYLRGYKLRWWFLTLLCLMVALLVKPTSVFIGLPMAVLVVGYNGWRALLDWRNIMLAVLSLLPLFAWRVFIKQFPEGIPASDWLYNGVVYQIDPVWGITNEVHPRWRPLWWRWMFYERLTKTVLGYSGLVFFVLGLLPSFWYDWRQRLGWRLITLTDWFVYGWCLSCFIYLAVFATGNIRHDYYQYLLLPCVCLVVARGIDMFYRLCRCYIRCISEKKQLRLFAAVLTGLLIIVGLYFGWRENKNKFDVARWDQVRLGQRVAEILPMDAVVIAHTFDGDTNFLFQTGRRGWSEGMNLEHKLEQGAEYFIGTDTDDLYHYLLERYKLIYQDDDGYVFDLKTTMYEATYEATL